MSYKFSWLCNSLFKTPLKRLLAGADSFFELHLVSAMPLPITCRLGFPTGKNLLFSFPNNARIPKIPTKKQVDELISELEGILEGMMHSKEYVAHTARYLNTVLSWMFFIVARRCFDFNLFQERVNPEDEVFKQQLNFWEFLTKVISKIWFFLLLIELRKRSEKYFLPLENFSINLSGFHDVQMERLLIALGGDAAYGIPAYVSEGEIVILREVNADEMLDTFIDTNKQWIKDLHARVNYGKYKLRYQYPYGKEISSYPIEVALSFKSASFMDNGLGDWFGENGLEHPFSKLGKG